MYWICVFFIIFFIVFMFGYMCYSFVEGDFNYENWSESERNNLVVGSISIAILLFLAYGIAL